MELLRVRVVANDSREAIKVEKGVYFIAVKEPAEENRANTKVLIVLSRYLGIPVQKLRMVRGHHSPSKIVSVVK